MNKAIIKDYKGYLAPGEKTVLQKKFEGNFDLIVNTLKLKHNFPAVTYYLFPSEEIKIQETGEDGYAETDRKKFAVYLVYNQDIQPTGPHELVHLLTDHLGWPNYVFNEGLAEYFAADWKAEKNGRLVSQSHHDWVREFIKENRYISISDLFDDAKFWDLDPTAGISYPESGSFMKYLIGKYGIEKIIDLYGKLKRKDPNKINNYKLFRQEFDISVKDAEKEWLRSLSKV